MRITNNMLSKNYVRNLNTNLSAVSKYQNQLSSLKKMTRLADDPAGVLTSMKVNVRMYKTKQYQDTISTAKVWLKDNETVMVELNEVIQDAYEKAVQGANSYLSPAEKEALAKFVAELRDHALDLGNSRSNGRFIFGGFNTATKPFTLDADGNILYNGMLLTDDSNPALIAADSEAISYEVGFGVKMDVSMPGTKLMAMGPDNIYTVLDGLYKALRNDAPPEQISEFAAKLQTCQSELLTRQADVGGKLARLELLSNRYEDDILNYSEVKSKVEDIDIAEVTMQYKQAEAVFNAALAIGGNILMPTLVNYLSK